jgi:hypothetical protein
LVAPNDHGCDISLEEEDPFMDNESLFDMLFELEEEVGITVKSAKTYESLKGMITFSIAITIIVKKLNTLLVFPIQQQKDSTKKFL